MKRHRPPTTRLKRRPDRYERAKRKQDRTITAMAERSKRETVSRPKLTAELAHEFALLLASGVPADASLKYLDADRWDRSTKSERSDWLASWANDDRLLAATKELNSGEWHHLDADRRLSIALDKHLSELAYLIYANHYTSADDDLRRKMDHAVDRLTDYLASERAKGSGDESGYKKFLRDIAGEVEKTLSPVKPAEGTSHAAAVSDPGTIN